MRAESGFGFTMTCASHVQFVGKGFPRQLATYEDAHFEGHQRLATVSLTPTIIGERNEFYLKGSSNEQDLNGSYCTHIIN